MADEGGKTKDDPVFILGFKTVDEYSQEGIKRVIEATKAFQALPPSGPLWDLQKSYPEFSRAMKNSRTRILPIMKTLLEHAKISTHDFKRRDLEEKFDFIVDSNDDILERIATALDDASGLSTRTEILVVNQTPKPNTTFKRTSTWGKKKPVDASQDSSDSTIQAERSMPVLIAPARPIKKAVHRIRVTEKPQLKFKVPVDNSLTPFVPKLKDKPNSLKPLSILPEYNRKNEEFYGHPYQIELNRWVPNESQMTKVTPTVPSTLENQSFNLVQTPEELESLLGELLKVEEIAVDVEHHSYRTFLGITCVIQLSTRHADYVIDALALREELSCLNEVLTKPKIMKVFHGATSDIEWLQQDCGLYIVGMFDTYVAAKQLGFQHLSLQFLLDKYCHVSSDKTYQLADWRIRPLPDDMLFYARQDTHYLLYIYDLLKNELIEKGNQHNNLLTAVYDESTVRCLRRYEKPTVIPQLTLRKTRRVLNNRQLHAFTEIFKWRDATAREKDESLGYVLPNHMLFMIAETLPKEMTGILACCDPVPVLVHANLGILHRIVLKARDLPVHEEKIQASTLEKRKKLKNWVVIMNSIHDIEGDDQDITIPKSMERESYPEPWGNPVDMSGVQVRTKSTLLLGRPGKRGTGGGTTRIRRTKETANNIPGTSNAFERYELSSQILEMLKDPVRKESADMNDPTVRVVYETLYVDPAEEEAASLKNLMVVNQELVNVLPKSDFVPFNPVAEFMKQQEAENKKNKKRKVKNEIWDDDKPYRSSNDNVEDALRSEVEIGDDAEDGTSSVPIPQSKSEKRRDKKKNKSKIVDKLKFWKTKRKREEREEGEIDDEDEVVCLDDEEPQMPSPPKRFKEMAAERIASQSPRGGKNSFRGRNRGRDRGDNDNGGRGRKGNRRGKKSGFFNAFRKPEGRSVTYK